MKSYIRYGSIILMLLALIVFGYQMTCSAVLLIYYRDYKTAVYFIMKGSLAALFFLLLFYQKELNTLYLKHKAATSGSLR